MEIEEMMAQADHLMHIAISKCDSLEDAQDLVQNTLLDGLHAINEKSNPPAMLGRIE